MPNQEEAGDSHDYPGDHKHEPGGATLDMWRFPCSKGYDAERHQPKSRDDVSVYNVTVIRSGHR
jgi:hypothetical protein